MVPSGPAEYKSSGATAQFGREEPRANLGSDSLGSAHQCGFPGLCVGLNFKTAAPGTEIPRKISGN